MTNIFLKDKQNCLYFEFQKNRIIEFIDEIQIEFRIEGMAETIETFLII